MKSLILAFFLCLVVALPARAVTLVLDDSDVFSINSGDVFENVVMFDTATVTMNGGDVTGHFLMLDLSTATLAGGTIGDLITLGDAVATVVIQPGSLEVDGLPTPDPATLFSVDCPSCTLSAILADGTPVGPVPASVLQSGQVDIVAVPEPEVALLFGLGLLGLGLLGRKV